LSLSDSLTGMGCGERALNWGCGGFSGGNCMESVSSDSPF